MKPFIVLLALAMTLTSCQQTEQRYTQQSSEIDTVKKLINDYNNKNYDLSVFADTSKIYLNTKDDAMSKSQLLAMFEANDANFESRKFLKEDQEYEMVTTDDGETWVNCWLDWQATVKGSEAVVDIPMHLTYRFVDGKVVHQVGMWDTLEITNAVEAAAMAAAGGDGSSANASGSASSNSSGDRGQVKEVAHLEAAAIEENPSGNNASSVKGLNQLSARIGELLSNPDIDVDGNSKNSVRLIVNSSNQLVVLGVDAESSETKDFIQKRLNYQQLDFEFTNKMKVYSIPVIIVPN